MSNRLKAAGASLLGAVILVALLFLLRTNNQTAPTAVVGITGLNTSLPIEDKHLLHDLEHTFKRTSPSTRRSGYVVAGRYVLLSTSGRTEKLYYLNNKLVHGTKPIILELKPHTSAALEKYFKILGVEYYGEYLPWSEARKLLPKNGTATVIDFETGLKFRVQRRAGSEHADVQPLTALDTMTMKKIYNGKWSWRRRAIIIQINDRRIAASMNGMPHGAGAINDNDFPGHFCIHFQGSKVHKSRNQDLAHQLMIAKAAGVLEEKIWQASPRELIAIFYTALKQHDWGMASLTLRFTSPEEFAEIKTNLGRIDDINTFTIDTADSSIDDLFLPVATTVTWRKPEEKAFTKASLLLLLTRDDFTDRWYISATTTKLPL